MRIPVAKEGVGLVSAAMAGSLACLTMGGRALKRVGFLGVAASAGLAALLRDPERFISPIEHGILSPSDGRITRIESGNFPAFGEARMRKFTITTGLFDCRVVRAATSGTISHLPRSEEDSSGIAEVGIDGEFPVFLRVHSAMNSDLASDAMVGDEIEQGDRIGIAKFGTSCEIFFPARLELIRNVGDDVIAGITALAKAPDEERR